MILLGDLLRAQMLLDRHRIVGAALDGRIVGDDHAVLALHDADPGHDAGCRRIVAVHTGRGERRELEKVGSRIDQALDAFARGELIAPAMLFDRFGASAAAHAGEPLAQLGDQPIHPRAR